MEGQALGAGVRIGPYEILAPIGAGGMGEVYRARDTRLGRDVALKLLPARFASDADRLRRFEQEARAAGSLDHPNIVSVHDVGTHEGAPYVVMEYLEGENLRSRLKAGRIPFKKTLDLALQMARGLATAHEKGIVHRDIKPENLFVTAGGPLKILDFGVAKLLPSAAAGDADAQSPTASMATEPGAVFGTIGYMSPEQVRGLAADSRSDIFSFGSVLFEMATGRKAFLGDSSIEVLNAILKTEPPAPSSIATDLPPAFDALVLRCLEKDPKERFQSLRDVAFLLESMTSPVSPAARGTPKALRAKPAWIAMAATLALGLAIGGAATWLLLVARRPSRTASGLPSFRQLTFHRGTVYSARFNSDGSSVIYSAAWEGRPKELFTLSTAVGASRPLGFVNADIAGISPSEEMLLILRPDIGFPAGMLARVPLAGGAKRDLMEKVFWADWDAGGTAYAIVRSTGNEERLEFPAETALADSNGEIAYPRLSPKGDLIAALEWKPYTDSGSLFVAGRGARKKVLSSGWASIEGLAWNPEGSEVWFTAAREGRSSALYAVNLAGKERLMLRAPGRLVLHDVSRKGQAVAERNSTRMTLMARSAGWETERDFSWLDGSTLADLSADGETLLFYETGEGAGKDRSFYSRKADGSDPVRLGEGLPLGLSPDGRWVLALSNEKVQKLEVWPTGAGEKRTLPSGGVQVYDWAGWLPDGQHVLVSGNEMGKESRLYVQPAFGPDAPRPVSREGVSCVRKPVSPDGKSVIAWQDKAGAWGLFSLADGESKPLTGLSPDDRPLCWSGDGRSVYVKSAAKLPGRVYKLDVATGKRVLWKEIRPMDCAGVLFVGQILITPDEKTYAYNYARLLSDLYLIENIQ